MKKKININIEEHKHKKDSKDTVIAQSQIGFLTTKDTGSAQSQIGFLTTRIQRLTDHVKRNRHDNVSILSIKKLVSKKRKLMKYILHKNLKIEDKNIET